MLLILSLVLVFTGCEGPCTVLPLPELRLPGVSPVPALATLPTRGPGEIASLATFSAPEAPGGAAIPQVLLSLDGTLYTLGLADGTHRQVSLQDPCSGQASVTADGQWVACRSTKGALEVTSVLATQAAESHDVGIAAFTPAWSPDGLHLAAEPDATDCALALYATTPAHAAFHQTALLSIPSLLPPPGASRLCVLKGVSWSPDGAWLAFLDWQGDPWSFLYLLRLASLPATILTGDPEPVTVTVPPDNLLLVGTTSTLTFQPGPPTWTPDSQRITYSAGDISGIKEFTLASHAQTTLLRLPTVLVAAVAWSPDGHQLVFAVGRPDAGCGEARYALYTYTPSTAWHPAQARK